MGCRARSRRVGGGAFAWRRGGWRRGGARAQRVGGAGEGWGGLWWGFCGGGGGLAPWRGSCAAGWRRGGTCAPRWGGAVARFSRGGLALKSGLHAVLGQRRNSVAARLAHRDRVVAADLRVAKGGGGGHDLRVATWRRRGLARLEGWDMGVGIMWWRGGGLRTRRVGERGAV